MHTVKQIKGILNLEHLFISKRRGQNFLVDQAIQKRIIKALAISAADCILEIGPGLGALTEELARQAKEVIAVEKDRGLAKILAAALSKYNNLQVICKDILGYEMARGCENKLKVVGNLPYYITTPIIAWLLESQRLKIKDIFITVQTEVGRRMLAKAGNKDYSALSVLVQFYTQAKLLFAIPKKAFYPQPKVNSVFLHLRIRSRPAVQVQNVEYFFKIVRSAFNQRRKTILNSLTHKMEPQKRNLIQQLLKQANIDLRVRPERLVVDDFAAIAEMFTKKGVRP